MYHKEDIWKNPFLISQLWEVQLIKNHWSKIFDYISNLRPEINEALVYDLIIKSIRIISCNGNDCGNCFNCHPELFMDKKNMINILKNKESEIINLIANWLNNSYNVPERWIVFQNIIDKFFSKDDNIVVCEIWCWWWLIWKVLTNSNYSREYFANEYSHLITPENDERQVKYYWIDPNLLSNNKDILMMINWSSEYAKKTRTKLEKFLRDTNFKSENIILEKKYLSETTMEDVQSTIMKLLHSFGNNKPKQIVLISSVVRYHFNNSQMDLDFLNSIQTLLSSLHKNTWIAWYYISKEMYWADWQIYPSWNNIPHQFIVKSLKINEEGIFWEASEYKELWHILI